MKQHKKLIQNILFIILIGILLFLFQKNITLMPGSDDTFFLSKAQTVPYLTWIIDRYQTWSSRIGADTLIYFLVTTNLVIWKILNILMLFLLSFSANRIFKKTVVMIDFIFVLLTFGLIENHILSSSSFCFNGSFNYLWPSATGLFALIPLADLFFRSQTGNQIYKKIIYPVAITYTCLANEQMGLILLAFYALYVVYAFIKKLRIPKEIYLYCTLIFCLLLVVFLAPGNSIRYTKEIARWYPDFKQISLLTHLERNIAWFFDKMFSLQKYLILVLGIISSYSYAQKFKKRNYLLELMTALVLALLLINGLTNFSTPLFIFNGGLTMQGLSPYIFWSIYFLLLSYTLLKIDEKKVVNILIFLAGICSMLMMWISPTIYGSGNRVMLINSIFLVILINKLRIDYKLNFKSSLLIYGLFPLINMLILFYLWNQSFQIYY